MSRDNMLQARLSDKEYEYLEALADEMGVSNSEAIRTLLYDSRFLYSDGVDFGEIGIDPTKLIDEDESPTTGRDAVRRILE